MAHVKGQKLPIISPPHTLVYKLHRGIAQYPLINGYYV